jgi:hypothetical protein
MASGARHASSSTSLVASPTNESVLQVVAWVSIESDGVTFRRFLSKQGIGERHLGRRRAVPTPASIVSYSEQTELVSLSP